MEIEYCSNCILLIRAEAITSELRFRVYVNATVDVIDHIPAYSILKQGQIAKFKVYGKPNFRGKIINFAGSVELESTLKVDNFDSGIFYQLNSNHRL